MREGFVTAVLSVAEQIPPGHVLTYGDIADLLEGVSARSVGRALSQHGDEVPWWRVVRADGTVFTPIADRAAHEHDREGTPVLEATGVRSNGWRVNMKQARWDPTPAQLARLERGLVTAGWRDDGPLAAVLSEAGDGVEP